MKPIRHLEKGATSLFTISAIPFEVLALAFIEFVFVSAFAALLWYMFSGK